MEVRAKVKQIRVSPRKMRLVVDLIRGMKATDALNQLNFINKRATVFAKKLLNSAIANAENNFELDKNNLFIKEIRVDEGTPLKRWMPRARGRATQILKRSSHINIILGELVDSGIKTAKKQEIEKPIKLEGKITENDGVKIKGKGDAIKEGDEKSHGKAAKLDGAGKKGFGSKMFQRKSGSN